MNKEPIHERIHFDFWLLLVTVFLVAMGVIMVYSSSAMFATEKLGDSYYFLKKEVIFVMAGFVLLFVGLKIPYYYYKKLVYPILGLAVIGLTLTYIPGLRAEASGAARWVRIGGLSVQPSEFAKLAVILFLAYSLSKKARKIKTFTVGFLSNAIIVGIVILLILGGRDLGAAMMVIIIAGVMMYVAGVKNIYLAASVILSMPMIYLIVASEEYRRKRILAFFDPWSDRYGSGFQMIQSFVAFSEGGVFGQGLGEGRQKLFYLPEAHTDFIASVIGEELGMIGISILILFFVFFAYRGVKIIVNAPDTFSRYLSFGITVFIVFQAIMNLAVVMGLFPTKGMVLPFVSYGGSAMLTMLFATGILLNISSYRKGEKMDFTMPDVSAAALAYKNDNGTRTPGGNVCR